MPLSVAAIRSIAGGRRALRMASEEERDRMAQRVHDRVMPRVSEGLLALEVGDPARSERAFRTLGDDLREMIMSDQSLVLREAGLAKAIEDVIERCSDHGPVGRIEAHIGSDRPAWEVEVTALRVAQGAIDNVLRHASADSFRVRLDVGRRHLRMEIEDDGVGVDHDAARGDGLHLGIRAMEARAKDVGAAVTFSSNRASGTLVRFQWPA